MASNEGMVAVVRGLGESGIAVTLMDGNKQYTLMPNDLTQGNQAPRNPSAPNAPQQRQNQHHYNTTYSPPASDHHQNHCVHNHHQEFDNQSQRNQIFPNLRLENIPNYQNYDHHNHRHQEQLYPRPLNHVGSSTERCEVRRESGVQVCDGRYASTYQTNHCYIEPTSPDYNVTEFPPQRPNPYPGHGNFVVGDPGSGESNHHTSRSTSFRGAMSWVDRGAVCSPRPSRHPDAFVSSLRKYPCTSVSPDRSAEIVERLISYTQAKHFGTSQNQSRTSTSSSRPNQIGTSLNPRMATQNRLHQFATKRPSNNTYHDERPTHDGRADDVGVFDRSKDIRFKRTDSKRAQSSDNLTYSKNTISTETQATPIKVSQEVETAVIIPPETRTIAIQITHVQSRTTNKQLKEKFTLKAVQTTVSLIDIKERLLSGQHTPKIVFRPSKSEHVIITQSAEKLRLEILEWIRGVSLKPSKDKNERKQRRQLLRILTNKLNKLYAKNKLGPNIQEKDPGYIIEKSYRPMSCQLCNYVNGAMPMNMCDVVNDSTAYFKENQIFYQIMDCGVRKEFEDVISIWLNSITDPSVQDKQTILNNFIDKIKIIIANRPVDDREYKSILKGVIMDLIESVPICFDGSCNKTVYKHRIADRLIRRIIELPGDVVYHTIHNLIQPTERELQRFVHEETFNLLENYRLQYLHVDCVERIRRDLTDILLDSMEVIRFGNHKDVKSEISYWLEVSFGIHPRDAEKTARTIIEHLKVYLNNKIDKDEMLDDSKMSLEPNKQNPAGSYLVYTSKSQEKVGKSRKSISMVMKKNNVTDTSMPGVSGQDVKGLSDNYLKLISQQIDEWLNNLQMQLPKAKDKKFRETAVNDLAKDIIDRHKYLELNPAIQTTEAEELEHLKYQIFKWINKFVGENNKNTISHAPDLMKRIKKIPIPMHNLPRQSINKSPESEPTGKAGLSASKTMVDEVNDKIITMLRETPTKDYSNPKDLYKTVREFSESLDSKMKSTSKNPTDIIHKQVPSFCKKALKIKRSTLIDNFKEEINNVYLNKATPTDNDKEAKIVTQNLEDMIHSWIDTFPDEAAIVEDRYKLVHSFASRLSGIHKAMSNSAWYETKMREEINTWINNLSNQPQDKKGFREKYTNALVQSILDTSLDSTSKEDVHRLGNGVHARRSLSFSQDTEDCCQYTEELDAKRKLSFSQDTEVCSKSIPCQTISAVIERRASADQIIYPSSSEDETRNRRKSCPGAVSPLELKCSQKNDSTQVQKGLEIYLREWVEKIPIDAKTSEEKEIASKARTGIYHGIGKKIIEIRSNYEAFWNQFLCEDMLDDEIDSLLDCLPQTPLMQSKRHALKVQLIQRVTEENDEMKHKLRSESYRQQLKDTLSETLPSIELDTADQEALEELAKDDLVDNFIQENYKGNDDIQKLVYKGNIFKEIKYIAEFYSKNNKGKPLNIEQLQKEIYNAMQKVPIPAEEALEDQIKEIIMKKEISEWYDDLPVKPTHDPKEELERKKFKSFLAKKILEIEKQPDQSNSIDGLIKHEISKWLEKSPLKKDADLKINDMVEELTKRMSNNPNLRGAHRRSFLGSSCQNNNDKRKSIPQDLPSYSTFAGNKPQSSSLTHNKTIEGRKHIAEDLSGHNTFAKNMSVDSSTEHHKSMKVRTPIQEPELAENLSGHNTFSRNMIADSSIAHHKSNKGRTSIQQEPGKNTFASDVVSSTSETPKRKSIPRAQQTTEDDTLLASVFDPSTVSDYEQDVTPKTMKFRTLETSTFDPKSVSALQPEATSKSYGSLPHIGPYDEFRSQPPLTSTPVKARRKSHQTSRNTINSPTFPRTDDSDIDGSIFQSVSERQSRGILGTSQVPGPSCCSRETSDRNKKSSEILYDAITNWCNRIPFPPACSCVDQDNIKATKLNLSSKLIFKLGEVIANPEIFNDKFLFENYIENEIDQILDSVSKNDELNRQREKLKYELINQLEAVRHLAKKEQDGHNYRKSIIDTIQKVVPKSCGEKNADNMRDKIADSIIEMKFTGSENSKKSKKYVMDEIGRLVAASKCCGKRMPPKQLKEKLYNSVVRIPTPNKDNLMDELGEIRLKKELSKWFKKLPLKLEDDEQKQRVHKITTILANKILEIEKQFTPDQHEYQEKMSNEILKWVSKLPLKPKQESKVQKSIKDFVTKLKKSYQYRQDVDKGYELNNEESVDMTLQSDQDESDAENPLSMRGNMYCGCSEHWMKNYKKTDMECYPPIGPWFWYPQPPGPYPRCYGHPYMPPCYR